MGRCFSFEGKGLRISESLEIVTFRSTYGTSKEDGREKPQGEASKYGAELSLLTEFNRFVQLQQGEIIKIISGREGRKVRVSVDSFH